MLDVGRASQISELSGCCGEVKDLLQVVTVFPSHDALSLHFTTNISIPFTASPSAVLLVAQLHVEVFPSMVISMEIHI